MAKNKKQQADTGACPLRKTSIGGQALMEGIMMHGPKMTAMAVRNTQGDIVLEKFPTEGKERAKFFKLPIIRGVFGFIDSMTLGYKCLMRSAEISGLEEVEAEMAKEKTAQKALKEAQKAVKKGTATPEQVALCEREKQSEADAKALREAMKAVKKGSATEEQRAKAESHKAEKEALAAAEKAVSRGTATDEQKALMSDYKAKRNADFDEALATLAENSKIDPKKNDGSLFMSVFMVISVVLSVGLMLGLFFFLPVFLYQDVLEKYVSWFPKDNRFLQSAFETTFRLLLMLGYMLLMRLMRDIRRTFQYHGAEHKTIFCYEHGLDLTVENVRKERRFHPRCGTSFLILMLLLGIVIGFFIPATLPTILRTAIKLLLLPLTMGIGYELIKICGKHDNWLTRIIAAPGLWFQRITVMEPDDAMIECAIAAVREVIPDDGSDQI